VLGTKIMSYNVEIDIVVYNSKLRIIRFSPYWKINGSLSCWVIPELKHTSIYVVRQLAYSTELLVCINQA
jgi:hypothetical protein